MIVMGIFTGCNKKETTHWETTINDIDGNIYHTMTVGGQVWLVENLRTTRYRNGDPIPNIRDSASWCHQTQGAYCNYENDTLRSTPYGHLYNWYAVTDSRKLAPAGWHVASDAEWLGMINTLGGEQDAGGKIKEAGVGHWNPPNAGATNASGLTALPGGGRIGGKCYNLGSNAYFWTATEHLKASAVYRNMIFDYVDVSHGSSDKRNGLSIRCIKDTK